MIKLVRIQSDPDCPAQARIKNAETGETIHGVKEIDIHIGIMELPVATMGIYTEFDGLAKPIWKPAFDRAGRCESCRHWETSDFTHGHCELPFSDQFPNSNVMTRSDFGCVLWEPHDNDPGKDT